MLQSVFPVDQHTGGHRLSGFVAFCGSYDFDCKRQSSGRAFGCNKIWLHNHRLLHIFSAIRVYSVAKTRIAGRFLAFKQTERSKHHSRTGTYRGNTAVFLVMCQEFIVYITVGSEILSSRITTGHYEPIGIICVYLR